MYKSKRDNKIKEEDLKKLRTYLNKIDELRTNKRQNGRMQG